MSALLLQAENVTKRFGGVLANDGVSLDIRSGEIVGLIGPNGAGKTTFFDMLCGVRPSGHRAGPDAGRILFKDKDITRASPHRVCELGVGRAFQIVRIFDGMDVVGNVAIGALVRSRSTQAAETHAREVLALVGLADKAHVLGSELTLADRKRLEVARALATEPSLLMLDEVMAGLTPKETHDAVDLIRAINRRGITILLVEHVLEAVMSVCDRVAVLHNGRKIADGQPQHVVHDALVIEAYLGTRRV